MIWDEYYNRFTASFETTQTGYPASILDFTQFILPHFVPAEFEDMIVRDFANISDEDVRWFAEALEDGQRKWFAVSVIGIGATIIDKPFPEALFAPLIRAAIYEPNPSLNRAFVECASKLGLRRVNEALLEYIERGTDFEKAGAINALYWARLGLAFKGIPPKFTKEHAIPESVAAYDELAEVWMRRDCLLLEEFVRNSNVDVRRSIISQLNLESSHYPDEFKPLIIKAIRLARTHSDQYISHRIEVQLGGESLLMPLPERKPEPD